jgi:acyl-CoA oxidase
VDPSPHKKNPSSQKPYIDLYQISELWLAERGNSIAEGDFVVLCIRLASEVLLGRYAPSKARDPQCLLARHEVGVWNEARQIFASLKGGHRGPEFNARILPLSLSLVQATGQRMAYEAAKDALVHGTTHGLGMTSQVLDLYESTCMMEDQSWYVGNGIMSRQELLDRNVDAVTSMLPLLGDMINDTAVNAFIDAPMVGQDKLAAFFSSLPSFHGPSTQHVRAKL